MTEQFLPQGSFPNPNGGQPDGSGAGALGGPKAFGPTMTGGAANGSPFSQTASSFAPGGQRVTGQSPSAQSASNQQMARQPAVGQLAGMQPAGAPIAPAAARNGDSDYAWAQPSAAQTFKQEMANVTQPASNVNSGLGSAESAQAVPPVIRASTRQPAAGLTGQQDGAVGGGQGGSLPTSPLQSTAAYAGSPQNTNALLPGGVSNGVHNGLPQAAPMGAPVRVPQSSTAATFPAPTGAPSFGSGGGQPMGGPMAPNPVAADGGLPVPTVQQAASNVQSEAPTRRGRGVIESDRKAGGRVGMSNSLRAGDLAIDEILREVVEHGASDLHLTDRSAPMIRKSGALTPLEGYDALEADSLRRSVYQILTQKQREVFEDKLELDFAYQVPGGSRFRVNMYQQRDSVGAAFRVIPSEIKPLEDLGVPPVVATFSKLPRGLVLVTGPTGSGKSTTLASVIDLANRTRPDHIMTVEDPIEFLHDHKKALVNQREVGTDTWSFAAALKHVLRQDPDIILVGEMRDLETISVALTAAETGHLVFATLHTQDAAQTIDRVIDVFPPEQQEQIRVQLASAIQGVVCQTLCKRSNGPGRVVATEVMVATPGIRNLIREGKTHQIYSAMQAGKNHGMHTMDQHLADLVKTGAISYETGVDKCHHVEDFNRLAGRGGASFNTDAINGGM